MIPSGLEAEPWQNQEKEFFEMRLKPLLEGNNRDQGVIPFLTRQRWFGGKARQIEQTRVLDWGMLPCSGCVAFLVIVSVEFTDGGADQYCLPLSLASAQAVASVPADTVLISWSGTEGEAVIYDALGSSAVSLALLSAVETNHEIRGQTGRFRAFPTAAFTQLRQQLDVIPPVTQGPATSSNSFVLFGRHLLLKLFRKLESGINPDIELSCYLTEQTSFRRIPLAAGVIEYQAPGQEPLAVAMIQQLVDNQGDGWHHALREVCLYFQRLQTQPEGAKAPVPQSQDLVELAQQEIPADAAEVIGDFLHSSALLGRRTAELHLALAQPTELPELVPEPITESDVASWEKSLQQQAQRALDCLKSHLQQLPDSLQATAQSLLAARTALQQAGSDEPWKNLRACKIRCHGDYHLGQVLRADNDFVILDFEGEPARPLAERRQKQTPIRDVAGMLRSYQYAAFAGLFEFTQDLPDEIARLEPWAIAWANWNSVAFLREYLSVAHGAVFLPDHLPALRACLRHFTLEKALYELEYELNNRPAWVRIPLSAVPVWSYPTRGGR
jgi:maltose alpha-D-glucosyltransferase/alpha-amylase